MAGLLCKNSFTLSVKCPVFEVSYVLNVPSINCRVYEIMSPMKFPRSIKCLSMKGPNILYHI